MNPDIIIMLDFLVYLWETNRTAILYVAWLIQTGYMLGMIVK